MQINEGQFKIVLTIAIGIVAVGAYIVHQMYINSIQIT